MEKGYSFFKKAGLAAIALIASTVSGMAAPLEVTTTAPGTLASLISENDKWNTTELKVSGPLNGGDIRTFGRWPEPISTANRQKGNWKSWTWQV